MPRTAILIGDVAACARLERQLDLMDERPITLGWVLIRREAIRHTQGPFLGTIEHLEAIAAHRPPQVALISLPGVMGDLITHIRTRLRKLGIPDRFVPTLEDLVAGVGPRTNLEIDLSQLLDRPAHPMDGESIRQVIAGRRIAITGAGGSIGSELSRIVANFDPREIALIERSENALFEIDRQIARRHPELRRRTLLHDVVNARETLGLLRSVRPEVVFHAAAHKHVPMMEEHPCAAVRNNYFGTKSVADAADAVGAEKLVLISTDKAVNPLSVMGATKRLAELYVQHLNLRSATSFSVVRFGNVLGSSGSVLEIWSKQLSDGGPVTVTDSRMTRYFMTIQEAASLVIQSAALSDEAGDVFVLDMGEPVRILDLAKRYIALHGLHPQVRTSHTEPAAPGAVPIVFTGIRPGEKLHEELASDAEARRETAHPGIHAWMLPPPHDEFMAEVESSLTRIERSASLETAAELIGTIRHLLRHSRPQPTEAAA